MTESYKLQRYIDAGQITEDVLDRLLPEYFKLKLVKSLSAKENIERIRLLKIIFEDKYPEYII